MNYFDHAASSTIYPEVLDILLKTQRQDFANPSSQHILGHNLLEKITAYRQDFLNEFGAQKNDHFIFTSSATESNNTVIKGLTFNAGDVILYCKGDHPSVTVTIESLVLQYKVELKLITLNSEGLIDEESLNTHLDKKVKLVVLSNVNNQSGVIFDVVKMAQLIKEKTEAHVHIDAVQAFGKFDVKVSRFIDSMSVTSHKIGGPKGIAGLFLKHQHKVKPLLLGGGQEEGFRSSTVAYPLVASFYEAMKISLIEKEKSRLKIIVMNEGIRGHLKKLINGIQFPFKATSPYIISFIIPGIPSDVILRHLEMHEVFISSTSACSSKIVGFNPTLMALNIPEKFHKNFLRISLSPRTTEAEVTALIKEFSVVWDSLKHMQKR